ncbi:MAG: ATP-dependent Clp protease proteolytic subunit [Stellaceae bacterium]
MSNGNSSPPQGATLPTEIYCSLAGPVDQAMVQRVFNSMAIAINGGVKTIHMLLQSGGGGVAEGVGLHNYFKSLPLDLHFYNGGTISSIAVIVFLGAGQRYASANATFMIHKTHSPAGMPSTQAARLHGLANSYEIEDRRTRSILETGIPGLSQSQFDHHLDTELPFDANEALGCGLITGIQDFRVPPGHMLSNI